MSLSSAPLITIGLCRQWLAEANAANLLPNVSGFGVLFLRRKSDGKVSYRISLKFKRGGKVQNLNTAELVSIIPQLAPYEKQLIIISISVGENGVEQEL
jgi:hypothetical protein